MAEGYFEDVDTDANWVKTLVYGARMLCREAARHQGRATREDIVEKIEEARKWVKRAKERVPFSYSPDSKVGGLGLGEEGLGGEREVWRRLVAELDLAQGICEVLWAVKGEEVGKREERLLEGS